MRATMTRGLVLLHRWLGIVLCLVFAIWFASGAVLMYVPFSALPETERLARIAVIDTAAITVTPAQALDTAGVDADRLRLIGLPSGPAYVIHPAQGGVTTVDARTGIRIERIDPLGAGRIAAHFAGRPVEPAQGPLDYDQWIVHQRFDPYRPLYRVPVGDQPGTVLYVSARSGDVLQRTTRRQRGWNYVGAVAHWIYPTVLRKSWALWDQVVWWLSLAGLLMAVAGLWLGMLRSTKSVKNPRLRSVSPFKRWLRWHHVAGLSVGLFLITWIFSGWLSMDHGRLFTSGTADAAQLHRFRGLSVTETVAPLDLAGLTSLGPLTEAEFVAVGGERYVVGHRPDTAAVSIHPIEDGRPMTERAAFADEVLARAVQAAWPAAPVVGIGAIAPGDPYGQLIYEPLPASTRRVVLGDTPPTWVHVDAASGRILQVMDRSRRVYRWLFSGLHSFDLPGLDRAPTLRQVSMLSLLAGGFLLSLTGAVIGIQRLRRGAAGR